MACCVRIPTTLADVLTKFDTLKLDETPSTSCFHGFQLFDKIVDIPDIAYEVISKIPYNDLVNLASTCRKWYKMIVNAPQNVKPILTDIVGIEMVNGRLECGAAEDGDDSTDDLSLKFENVFNMIQAFKYDFVDFIHIECVYESPMTNHTHLTESLEFLIKYRTNFKTYNGVWFTYLPTFEKIDSSILMTLFTSFKEVKICCNEEDNLPLPWQNELQEVILSSAYQLKSLECQVPVDFEFCCQFLQKILNNNQSSWKFDNFEFFISNEECVEKLEVFMKSIDNGRVIMLDSNNYDIDVKYPDISLCIYCDFYYSSKTTTLSCLSIRRCNTVLH